MGKYRSGRSVDSQKSSEWLKETLKERGLRVAEVASGMGVSRVMVYQYLNGQVPINLPWLLAFAYAFGMEENPSKVYESWQYDSSQI